VAQVKAFNKGNLSEKALEKTWRRPAKSVVDKARYIQHGPRPSQKEREQQMAKTNGVKYTLDEIIENLSDAGFGRVGGRGWKGKLKNALVNPNPKVKWNAKNIETRSIPALSKDGVAHLILMKSGEVRVYPDASYEKWKNGCKKGLKKIHGPKARI
jgi:hypothetical protein